MNFFPRKGFTLVEVTLALGICAFVLVALIGLFSTGLKASRESEDQVQAANLASRIVAIRQAAPTNASSFPDLAIPASAMTNAYADAYGGATRYVGFDGMTNSSSPAYRVTCKAGTNALTGSSTAQVYLLLTWPPQAAATNAAGRYEILTYIPLR